MIVDRLRIGPRLALGFALVLFLALSTVGVGVWRLGALSEAADRMMNVPLAKERLANEWFRNITAGVKRTTALAKSSDPSLEAVFAEEIAATTTRTNAVMARLGEMADAEDKRLLDKSAELRKAFLAARLRVLDAKKEGHADQAERLFQQEFQPSARIYLESVQAFVDHQAKAIDEAGATIEGDAGKASMLLLVLAAVTLALGTVLAWVLARSITRPLASALDFARAVAAGDLSQRGAVGGRCEVAELLAELRTMQGNLGTLITQVRQGVDAVGSVSEEIARGNADLSQRTEQTASNLQATASSMSQLTGTVRQSADAAAQANQLATSAAQVARRGGEVVSQVVSTMDEINTSSRKISDIIGTIDGIAFQTNILALNAAVEAARAGEQGRGFAVVAGEVRSLAQRSAEAAREIKALIGASVDRVEAGARLVQDAGGTMDEIVSSVQRVSDIIAEISAAASEQSGGIGQVNQSVAQLDQMTQQNAALVEQSAAAAESLKGQASRLATVIGQFRTTTAGGLAAPSAAARPDGVPVGPAARPVATLPATRPAPAPATFKPARAEPAAAQTVAAGDDWETF